MVLRRGKREPEHTAGIWRAGRIRNMLRNPADMGKWEWRKCWKKSKPRKRISGYCPPIVSEDLFHKDDKVLRNNNLWAPRNMRRQYLLRGFIKCDECGHTFCGRYSKVGPSRSQEKTCYRCNGKTHWRKRGIEKCDSPSLDAKVLEEVVWNDIKQFYQHPEVAIKQLMEQREPFDSTVSDKIKEVDKQLAELKRQEMNLLKIAAASQEVNTETLDSVLAENNASQVALQKYKTKLHSEKIKTRTLEDELHDVAGRLSRLEERIDQATYEEKRRAVEELVKEILVASEWIDG
jgi:site-specific DNA recombinase